MKSAFISGLLILGSFFCQAQFQPALFNAGWNFHKGDLAGDAKNADWQPVDLPHDWSIQEPFSDQWASATGYLPGGIGWYKKTFKADAAWRGKRVFIYFDGVYKNSEVYINGHLLGKRPNGFISFQYDLSPYLKFTGQNELRVKADHSDFADSRWYTGSGIYRNVYLKVKEPVHLGLWGVKFSAGNITPGAATINVDVTVDNEAKKPAPIELKMQLFTIAGKLAASYTRKISVKEASATTTFTGKIANPALWDVNRPNLYTLAVSVYQNGRMIDKLTQQVGIRNFRFDANTGFFLNGKSMKIKGVCIHDDAGALGVAVPEEVWVRRLKILKEGGTNSIRMGHNPHADYLYDLCDKMGFLVMDEAFDEWEIGKNKWVKGWNVGEPAKDGYHTYFKEWAERDVADMIKRAYNHPSIFLWSIGNEIDYPNDPYTHPVLSTGRNPQIYGKGFTAGHPPASELTPIAHRLAAVVRRTDKTRPVTAALAGVVMSNEVGYPEELDVVGYNYQEYRYAEDHKKYPKRVIYGSENGMKKAVWDAVDTVKYISAQYLWTGIDYLGEAGKWPDRSNRAGLIDLAGFKKPEYYYRQSLWADKPMIYLAVRKASEEEDKGIWSHKRSEPNWNWPAGTKTAIEGYTNCDEAELFLNGKSLGKIKVKVRGESPVWLTDFTQGELIIKGYKDGQIACTDTLKTFGEPAKVQANVDKESRSKGSPFYQVEMQVQDEKGNLVYTADQELTVTVTGPAKLVGLESGSSSSHESYQSNKRHALRGRLLAYVKRTAATGKVSLTVKGEGLKTQTLSLD